MASVDLRGIRKSYGPIEVVQGIDLSIRDGEFVALVGPSGCGKSTLLRMVAGLEDISAGELLIDGKVINHVPTRKRDMAMVFQSYALYPHMSVFDNMAFGLRLRKMERPRVQEGVGQAGGILGIQHLMQRYPRELSGGQRQRVAMGRAIVRHPKLFLFDEPLSNLDARLRVQMRTEVKALHQRLGATSIYVTHDQIEAMTMADRIVVLHGGQIAQIGSPLDLYDRPANLVVAGFIGSPAMNFLPGVYRTAGDHGTVVVAGFPEPLKVDALAVVEGRDVTFGIRPEHLDVTAPDQGLPAEVNVVEPTGAATMISVRVADTELTVMSALRLALAPGQGIGLTMRRDCAHVFDSPSGRRLSRKV
jgi:multiple sugar transport system ATP-binding protein